ncbi:uncharacterized protein LOC128345255 isoform X2 [Hemicordylus capensis]|uniref:uncharacterized protein LOC128345255 isoform X2 n=1 Tax=Hemicordylus capensis TaxID=884348 RepID=UPI002302D5A5|nr:uncharacterized protein LOC128345255 isoform X2 [Hemicordylus capensis]
MELSSGAAGTSTKPRKRKYKRKGSLASSLQCYCLHGYPGVSPIECYLRKARNGPLGCSAYGTPKRPKLTRNSKQERKEKAERAARKWKKRAMEELKKIAKTNAETLAGKSRCRGAKKREVFKRMARGGIWPWNAWRLQIAAHHFAMLRYTTLLTSPLSFLLLALRAAWLPTNTGSGKNPEVKEVAAGESKACSGNAREIAAPPQRK